MTQIHPTALVAEGARIGKNCTIGPFCIVGENVVLGDRCELKSHVVIEGHTHIGDDAAIWPFAVLGGAPQHLRYQGEPTEVWVGNKATIREGVTIHRGTEFGGGKTQVGSGVLLMAYSHVGHDCQVGDSVIVANTTNLAGHVEIGDHVIIGGSSAVAQFCRVGRYCFIGGGTFVRKDVPPFLIGKGSHISVSGANTVGLKRNGFSAEAVKAIRGAYRLLYGDQTLSRAIELAAESYGDSAEVIEMLDFIKSSRLGIHRE